MHQLGQVSSHGKLVIKIQDIKRLEDIKTLEVIKRLALAGYIFGVTQKYSRIIIVAIPYHTLLFMVPILAIIQMSSTCIGLLHVVG